MDKTPAEVYKQKVTLCSDHFESNQFNVPHERRRLVWNAVPTLFHFQNKHPQTTARTKRKQRPAHEIFDQLLQQVLKKENGTDNSENSSPPSGMDERGSDIIKSNHSGSHFANEIKTEPDVSSNGAGIEDGYFENLIQPAITNDVKTEYDFKFQPQDVDGIKVEGDLGLQFGSQEVSTDTNDLEKFVQHLSPRYLNKRKLLKCHLCGEMINRFSAHMQLYHPNQKLYPCTLCDEGFNYLKDFCSHMKTHAVRLSRAFKCDLCNKTLKSKQNVESHVQTHSAEKHYPCEVCGKKFKSKATAAICKHGLFKRKMYQCKTCGDIVTSTTPMNKLSTLCEKCSPVDAGKLCSPGKTDDINLSHNSAKQMFQCYFCQKQYTTHWRFKQHLNLHSGERPYECEVCHKTFYSSSAKRVHFFRRHSGKYKGILCRICGVKCKSILGRETHYLTHTPEERASYKVNVRMSECDVCGKVVRTNYMADHKLSHAATGSFICEVCGKVFKKKFTLKKHINLHHSCSSQENYILNFHDTKIHCGSKAPKLKRFSCDVCGKKFSSRQALQVHSLIHTETKSFKCQICEKSFRWETSLKRHHSVHSGQKPFLCDFCGKRFSQKAHLQTHHRIHTGEKPFKCQDCGKMFSDQSTLHKHKQVHLKI